MMEENQHIEKIFKAKLTDHQILTDEMEWSMVRIKLHRVRFYKFSFSNFNIYYLSAIVICTIFSTAAVINSFFFQPNEKYTIKTESSVVPAYPKKDSVTLIQGETKALKEKYPTQKNRSIKPAPATVATDTLERADAFDNSDTVKIKPAEEKAVQPVIPKKKKVVQIIQQDTIVIDEAPVKQKSKRRKE